jgi:hypothetical protein
MLISVLFSAGPEETNSQSENKNKTMRRILFLTLCFLFVWIGSGQAQITPQYVRYQTPLRFGFQSSPTLYWMNSDARTINPSGNNLGLRLGVKSEYYFRDKYAFTTGLGFAFNSGGTLLHDRGGRFWTRSELSSEDLRELPAGTKLKYALRYIEVPVSLKMVTNEVFRDVRFFFEAPVITLGFRSQARGDISGAGNLNSEDENIQRDVNLFNFAWGLGGGIEYNVRGTSKGDTNILVGVFYQNGFTDVTNNRAVQFVPDEMGGFTERRENSRALIYGISLYLGVMF